jgi:hypothetical protein
MVGAVMNLRPELFKVALPAEGDGHTAKALEIAADTYSFLFYDLGVTPK